VGCALLLAALLVFDIPGAGAQLHPPRVDDPLAIALGASEPSAEPARPSSDFGLIPADLRIRNAALIGGGVLLVGAYGMAKWWDDGFSGNFRTENEGWFGANTYAGGADKLGHAMFAYAATRVLSSAFRAVGNDSGPARNLALWSTLGVMTAVEIADGYSRRYKFSAQDAVMNVVGAGLGYLMERNPGLDQLVDMRLLYKKSGDSNFDPAGDYSGQRYLVTLKASGIPALRGHEPLRYLELAIGYGTRGYQDSDGGARSRNVYVGVSLNVAEILRRTVFRNDREPGRAQRAAELFFEHIQLPGTAALSRHRL